MNSLNSTIDQINLQQLMDRTCQSDPIIRLMVTHFAAKLGQQLKIYSLNGLLPPLFRILLSITEGQWETAINETFKNIQNKELLNVGIQTLEEKSYQSIKQLPISSDFVVEDKKTIIDKLMSQIAKEEKQEKERLEAQKLIHALELVQKPFQTIQFKKHYSSRRMLKKKKRKSAQKKVDEKIDHVDNTGNRKESSREKSIDTSKR